MNKNILNEAKQYVEAGDLDGLKQYYIGLRESDVSVASDGNSVHSIWNRVPSDWLFQKVYLHACLKKKKLIVDWLLEVYNSDLDDMAKIALRQVFPYGRWLLAH